MTAIQLISRMEKLDRTALFLAGVLMTLMVGALDVFCEDVFDYRFASTVLYLVPISIISWVCGKPGSMAITVIAVVTDVISSYWGGHVRHSAIYPAVDMALQLPLFIIFGRMLVALRKSIQDERKTSRTDQITKLLNVRGFEEAAELELQRMRRYPSPLTVVYFDVDNFKAVNDNKGHSYGNEILKLVGLALKGATRTVDVTARVGGDEFVALLPETSASAAAPFIERIKRGLSMAVRNEVTFSIGAVTFSAPPSSVDLLLAPADALMYAAKNSGKNTVVFNHRFPSMVGMTTPH